MSATKSCPRCGTALRAAGDRFTCPSCRVSLVRKPKEPPPAPTTAEPSAHVPTLDFAPEHVPVVSPSRSHVRMAVLGGAGLFLLLGTVLTGYCFAKTLTTSPEEPITRQPADSTKPEEPGEDWRVTLNELRDLVGTPPRLVDSRAGGAPAPPDPHAKKVNAAIDKGVAYLKQAPEIENPRFAGLAGLTLLECGVPRTDPVVERIAAQVRLQGPRTVDTYSMATYIWFLDRLGETKDNDLIRSLALRLIANQGPMAGWGYMSQPITPEEEKHLLALLAERPLATAWRQSMTTSLVPAGGKAPTTTGGRSPARVSRMDQLPVFKWEAGQKYQWQASGHEDNSLTQFAILALWAARKHGVPVERVLAFVEFRFRTFQNEDGSWGYTVDPRRRLARRDSMTCAGLLGLAVGRGLDRAEATQTDVKDHAIDKALVYVGQVVGKEALGPRATGRGPGIGHLIGAQAWGDLYFLWSLERMAVVWDLKTVAGKDWYGWGRDLLLQSQQSNGSWLDSHREVPDTCFALLFLKRVNVVQDLTAQLRLLGKVKDPGNLRPVNVLPGETVKPDEP